MIIILAPKQWYHYFGPKTMIKTMIGHYFYPKTMIIILNIVLSMENKDHINDIIVINHWNGPKCPIWCQPKQWYHYFGPEIMILTKDPSKLVGILTSLNDFNNDIFVLVSKSLKISLFLDSAASDFDHFCDRYCGQNNDFVNLSLKVIILAKQWSSLLDFEIMIRKTTSLFCHQNNDLNHCFGSKIIIKTKMILVKNHFFEPK